MMEKGRRALAFGLIAVIGATLICATSSTIQPFGTFPYRQIDGKIENAVGQQYLENATWQTGAANVVTTIVWGYRGYDTLGESTVLFTAVVGVIMVLRALRRDEQCQA
jgi:multisubunit Na+/H+ antiporter MnhB subunit